MARTPNSRRLFFQKLVGEACSFEEETRGVAQYRLSELDQLPPDKLASLVFRLADGWEISVRRSTVCARSGDGAALELFAADSEEAEIFNRINGQVSMGEAAAALAAELGWPHRAAFERTRALLIRLAARAVCVPINAPK